MTLCHFVVKFEDPEGYRRFDVVAPSAEHAIAGAKKLLPRPSPLLSVEARREIDLVLGRDGAVLATGDGE